MCRDDMALDQAGLDEVRRSLRLARRYRGSFFGDEELEYVASLLGVSLPYKSRRPRWFK